MLGVSTHKNRTSFAIHDSREHGRIVAALGGRTMEIDDETMLRGFPVDDMRLNLLRWWSHGKRHYPWRKTEDPYKVLIAEVLLHRTSADQVVPLYETFVERFSDVGSLATSSPDELTQLFRSAGLHWRWRLLHAMAAQLEEEFNGQIPEDLEILISLPGVSHYIASAVRCFAFGKPDVILDTNTVRVVGRLFKLAVTDSSRRSRRFRTLLEQLIDREHPREFNHALIDLAAQICRSKTPLHDECPLEEFCQYHRALATDQQHRALLR